ncbi:MAG: phosphotransferase [Rhodoferax sp.]
MTPTNSDPRAAVSAIAVPALSDWLSRHLPGFRGPLTVQRFEGGQSNPTFALDTPGARYVMRCKPAPAAQLLPSAHAIEREYRVMSALRASPVPVPEMLCLCEDERVIGRAFYIMSRVEGRIWWDQSLPGLSPDQRRDVYREMNRVLAALHALDPERLGLSDYGRAGNYFARQIKRWSEQYQASVTEPIPEMDRLIDWLPEHLPALVQEPGAVSIVHGDYRLDNLVFHPTQPRVIAVLDWELSTLGHPLADFSYHCMAWHIPPGAFRGIGGLDLNALGIPGESEYIAQYAQQFGRYSAEQIRQEWNYLLTYNLFRMAAILQGIAKRIELGTAASAQAKQAAAGARPLAQLAWQLAQRTT